MRLKKLVFCGKSANRVAPTLRAPVNRVMCNSRRKRAYSLLEVVLASSICATALVPALATLRDGLTLADTMDKRHLLLIYGVSKMEERLPVVAATWVESTITGDFATDGHANVRFTLTSSDEVASGGIVNRLMNVTLTTYSDDDGDDTMDSGEMRTTFTTKIGKTVTYETEASS